MLYLLFLIIVILFCFLSGSYALGMVIILLIVLLIGKELVSNGNKKKRAAEQKKQRQQELKTVIIPAYNEAKKQLREHPFNKIPIISLYDSTFVLWKRYPHN